MTEKTLKFVKGDETRPKVEVSKQDDWKNALFSDIYFRAFELIKDIIEMQKKESNNPSKIQKEGNNIIAFIGERGAGKTSCLQTIYKTFQENSYFPNGKINENNTSNNLETYTNKYHIYDYDSYFKKYDFITLPFIDPSYFEEKSNIIEIIIAQLFQNFKEDVENPKHHLMNDEEQLLERKRTLVKCFQKVKESLDCINEYNKHQILNDSIEELSNMASGSNLRSSIEKLIEKYLEYFKKDFLIIAIDDLDVQTKHTYKMIEQIRKYLIVNKIIILTGIKLVQLSDLIKQSYYEDYKILMDKDKTTDTIDDMTSRYLAKFIPISHRLFIPDVKANLKARLIIADGPSEPTIDEGVLKLIYSRTKLSFYNTREQESLIIPRNLRELLNVIALMYDMQKVPQENEEIKKEIIIKNRNLFKDYFIESWCLDNLNAELYAFVRTLAECGVWQANKYTIDFLYTYYEIKKEENRYNYDYNVTSKYNRGYNVSIADVNYMLDKISSSNNDVMTKCFIFAIKTLYSMALYDYFHLMKDKEYYFLKYNALMDRFTDSISPNPQWQTQNKMNYFSDYEKLMGGSLMHVSRNSKDNSRAYIGIVNNNRMQQIYKDAMDYFMSHTQKNNNNSSTKSDNKNSLEYYRSHSIEKKETNDYKSAVAKFNLFEFFILTYTFPNENERARTFRHCYYDSFPVSSVTDIRVASNHTAVLFNIIKYYNLYRKYKTLLYENQDSGTPNEKEDIMKSDSSKKTFIEFWWLTENLGKDSIIYKLLHSTSNQEDQENQNNTELSTKKEFRNKTLENTFIQNMEVLDILEDYFSNIGQKRYTEDNFEITNTDDTKFTQNEKQIEALIKYYQSLSDFEFYLYSNKEKEEEQNDNKEKEIKTEFDIIRFKHFKPLLDLLENIKKNMKKEHTYPEYYQISDIFFEIYNPELPKPDPKPDTK